MHGDFVALQERLFGRYSLERELGRGGSATVHLARELRLDRPVALKSLHPALAADADARERFRREARLAARLAHPHIVPVYAVGTEHDGAWLAMAFVDGGTLGARIRDRGPLPAHEAERILREIAWALGYAHAHGVLHRDLTLDNILLDRRTGRALLADFGLAREQALPDAGTVAGTPGYLAPEVIRGAIPDRRADLYALGVIGYTLLRGRPPFSGATTGELLAKHLLHSVPSLEEAGGASRRLTDAILACLAKDPDERPADTAALLARLDRAPEPVTIAPPLARWFARFERISPVYGMGVILSALYLFVTLRSDPGFGYAFTDLLPLAKRTLLTALGFGVVHVMFERLAFRRLYAQGFGLADVRVALPRWLARLADERRLRPAPPLWSRIAFDLALVGSGALALLVLVEAALGASAWQAATFIGLRALAPFLFLLSMICLGLALVRPALRFAVGGPGRRLISRFWEGPLADAFARAATWRQPAAPRAEHTLHRPTAMVLALAIEELWAALPPARRTGLGDVPAIARALESGARECRALADTIAQERRAGGASPGHGSLDAARADAEDDHREAVAALERTRLHLLRLLAAPDEGDAIHRELEAARALETRLLCQLRGHDDTRRLLRRRSSPEATPA